MRRSRRIFVGPCEIAGYYANLDKGFKALGVECDYITYTQHPFGYGAETYTPTLLRLARVFNGLRGKPNRPFIFEAFIALPGGLLATLWALYAIFRYDVFVFGFGHSLVPHYNWDLPILKFLGKTVISNLAHGSDARPPYIDGAVQNRDDLNYPSTQDIHLRTKRLVARFRRHERYATSIVGAPFSTTHFSKRRLINWFALGVPFNATNRNHSSATQDDSFISNNRPVDVVRILHSPSHPIAKGSPVILQAIQQLKNKGHEIELILLHGKPHLEVIREIQCCDFVVDQLYSDTPMAGFATEAAWFGKPAVVGGYAFDYLKTLVPDGMWPPSKICHPDEIEQAIEDLIVNSGERLLLGKEAQDFVREKWNAVAVARRYLRLIEGDFPEEWWLDPNSVTYLYGAGQTAERIKENIRQLVAQFGAESLQLSHRPDLERAFLQSAGICSSP